MPYLFRDTDKASQRLQILAEVFEPASRAFQQEVVHTAPELAIDLGCGPGYTTRLLAETTACVRAVGLDSSAHFIDQARQHASKQMSFLPHDITQVPFPIEPADLLSCRFLLTHLVDPQAVIERWTRQLCPQGLLLLEETEWIQTEHSAFRTYLAIVAAMLAHQDNQLYIGSSLNTQQPAGLQRRLSRVYHLPVTTAQAASMFYPNIQIWKSQPFIQANYTTSQIEALEQELGELAANSTSVGEITWGMRQIAYERVS